MTDPLTIIIVIYILLFSLSDILGDKRTNAIEAWWLYKAKRSLQLLTEQGKLTTRLLMASLVCTLFLVLFYTPLLIYVILPLYDPRLVIVTQLAETSVLWNILLNLIIAAPLFAIVAIINLGPTILRIVSITLLSNIHVSVGDSAHGFSPLHSPPTETMLCIKAIKSWESLGNHSGLIDVIWGKGKKENSKTSENHSVSINRIYSTKCEVCNSNILKVLLLIKGIYSAKGVVIFMSFFFLVIGTIAVLPRHLTDLESSQLGPYLFWTVVLMQYIYLSPILFYIGSIFVITSFILLIGSTIRITIWIIFMLVWFVLMAPPILLNKIASLTGQPSFFKVGKYLLLLIAVVIRILHS